MCIEETMDHMVKCGSSNVDRIRLSIGTSRSRDFHSRLHLTSLPRIKRYPRVQKQINRRSVKGYSRRGDSHPTKTIYDIIARSPPYTFLPRGHSCISIERRSSDPCMYDVRTRSIRSWWRTFETTDVCMSRMRYIDNMKSTNEWMMMVILICHILHGYEMPVRAWHGCIKLHLGF